MHIKYQIEGDHSIVLNSSMGWLLLYREYYGHDILPDLLPALETILHMIGNTIDALEGDTMEDIVKAVTADDVIDGVFIDLSGLEVSTLLNIFWAMAKNEDPSIASPKEFFDQFEVFALDEVAPKMFDQILKSCISSKNLKRLKGKYPFLPMILSSEH